MDYEGWRKYVLLRPGRSEKKRAGYPSFELLVVYKGLNIGTLTESKQHTVNDMPWQQVCDIPDLSYILKGLWFILPGGRFGHVRILRPGRQRKE